jgi:hypothetical protein
MSRVAERIEIATHLDVLDVLAKRNLKVLVFQHVDHADTVQNVGVAEFRWLLEQKMRQDGGPLIVAALEFVFVTREIAMLDWAASDGETQTCCGYSGCLTRSHVWGFALATYQSYIERVIALLQHFNDDSLPTSMGRLDGHDVAARHCNAGCRWCVPALVLGGSVPSWKVWDGVGLGKDTGRFKWWEELLKP